MSIKDDAFNLFIKVWNSPNREEAQAVVNKVKPGTYGVGNIMYPASILGMLLYNQQRVKALFKDFESELSSWNERELKILFGLHNQILHLNEQCLAPLAAELPEAINCINPYKEYPQTVSTEGFEELLFSEDDAREIIQSFHGHPAFDLALSTLPLLKQKRHSFDYDQTIKEIVRQLQEARLGGKPEWLELYREAAQLKQSNLYVYHHVGAVLSLHSSLSTLNQFIYQGLYRDELLRLTPNHIIDYMWTTAGAGPSMWLMLRPYNIMLICEPTDLIIVNKDRPGERGGLGDVLCTINSISLNYTSLSEPYVLTLRMIDERLNAYQYLLPLDVDK